jgi:hypothetical protein
MPAPTLTWWSFLAAVSLLNVLAWLGSWIVLRRRREWQRPMTRVAVRLQLLLSAGYVAGCAYRSWFPVFDVPRLCLVDSWLSSVIVGRTVATLAEVCFAAQWALLLGGIARVTGDASGRVVARLVVPLIVLAEVFSWHAVLTTSNLGHVIEETLWGICAALLVISLAIVWPRCRREAQPLLAAACVLGVGYVTYMFLVDVPMYWSRWLLDSEQGREYLSLAEGFADASSRWVVSYRWDDWRSEVVWMSAYFSVAVWASIALVHAPLVLGPRPTGSRPRPGRAGRSPANRVQEGSLE